MSNQEDPMRTTVKPVHQWTTMDGKSERKSNIEKWLFWAMFLWPVILLVCDAVGNRMHSGYLYSIAAYIGSPIFAAILIGIALRYYPASRRFLKWFAGIILVIALYIGVMAYGDSLQHGYWWLKNDARWLLVVWFDGLLVFLSAIYLIVPQRAWGWVKTRAKLLWKRAFAGRSSGVSGHEISIL